MAELLAFLGVAIVVIVTPGPGYGADSPQHPRRRPPRGRPHRGRGRLRAGDLGARRKRRRGRAARSVRAGLCGAQARRRGLPDLPRPRHCSPPCAGGARALPPAARPADASSARACSATSATRRWRCSSAACCRSSATRSPVPARPRPAVLRAHADWFSAYAFAVARAGDVLRRPARRRTIDAVIGTALVALGLRLATVDRDRLARAPRAEPLRELVRVGAHGRAQRREFVVATQLRSAPASSRRCAALRARRCTRTRTRRDSSAWAAVRRPAGARGGREPEPGGLPEVGLEPRARSAAVPRAIGRTRRRRPTACRRRSPNPAPRYRHPPRSSASSTSTSSLLAAQCNGVSACGPPKAASTSAPAATSAATVAGPLGSAPASRSRRAGACARAHARRRASRSRGRARRRAAAPAPRRLRPDRRARGDGTRIVAADQHVQQPSPRQSTRPSSTATAAISNPTAGRATRRHRRVAQGARRTGRATRYAHNMSGDLPRPSRPSPSDRRGAAWRCRAAHDDHRADREADTDPAHLGVRAAGQRADRLHGHVGREHEELERDQLLRPLLGRMREHPRPGEAPDDDHRREALDHRVQAEADQRDRRRDDPARDRHRALDRHPRQR